MNLKVNKISQSNKIIGAAYKPTTRASPTYAIAKKSGNIKVVSDFRKLNSCHPFPIPKIGDMILSMEGFTFDTILYLNMEYYHINL